MRHGAQAIQASTVADCASLADAYYAAFCRALLSPTWQAIALPSSTAVGPSVQMYARLTRAILNHDESICADPATISFGELGSHVDATTAEGYCHDTFTQAYAAGVIEIRDPNAPLDPDSLVVSVK
jgi:hypothetical protein